MNKPIRVLLADDHDIVRDGLKCLLGSVPDIKVVADVADGRSAIRETHEMSPDVVVMDISLPGLNGIDATREIAATDPSVKVLCLSMHRRAQIASAALRAGAAGYLPKNVAAAELIAAIREVAAGRTYVSPVMAGELVQDLIRGPEAQENAAFSRLSAREREVLQLIAEGNNTKTIASRLHISEKTVAAHRLAVMERLHLQGVADLTRFAIREGLVEP